MTFDDNRPRSSFPQSIRPTALHVECARCGLLVEEELGNCPGCGEPVAPALAGEHQAQCAVHADLAARMTCSECGRFCCSHCFKEALDKCLDCIERNLESHLSRFEFWEVLFLRSLLTQGVMGLLALGFLALSYATSGMIPLVASFLAETVLAAAALRSKRRWQLRRWPALLSGLNTLWLILAFVQGRTLFSVFAPALACSLVAAIAYGKVLKIMNATERLDLAAYGESQRWTIR